MKYTLLTLGCKVNRAEINTLESDLIGEGHEIVPLSESPDVCIVNTCTVTSKSDYQSRQLIRRALRTGARVVATGCYSELHAEDIREGISPDINIIPNSNKLHNIRHIYDISKSNTLFSSGARNRAFIKIQDGCNFRCSYCAIPSARGRSRSVIYKDIIDEINRASDSGLNEVVLTGIHIGLYGIDLKENYTLKGLIADILGNTSIPRIRLSSLEINEIDEELLGIIDNKRICPHLHLPLQSGKDDTLRRMGRHYKAIEFKEKMNIIRGRFPDISIGTDIIAGFPGETDEEFSETLNFVRSLDLSYMHVFPYSKRAGTRAAELPDHVDQSIKDLRAAELRTLSLEKSLNYRKRFIGSELDVIIENRLDDSKYSATSGNYIKINVLSDDLVPGELMHVTLTDANENENTGIPPHIHNV
ncbi:MAG: tRNA (N(6)-L-threonylcarbamoyladenosine(37)-C(2))-methylthiotransferase MtaB [Nitrospirota bacterium]|nr:MAG: tRNA (N(6)-L-threonylcarbamoyladenosine(37)-C(2))-methylthiotransferase MtaB [Nitrospirota bacterium]